MFNVKDENVAADHVGLVNIFQDCFTREKILQLEALYYRDSYEIEKNLVISVIKIYELYPIKHRLKKTKVYLEHSQTYKMEETLPKCPGGFPIQCFYLNCLPGPKTYLSG